MTAARKPRLFVIADIHGDYQGFLRVLRQMEDDGMNLKTDTLVQLGDMVDGYDHSKDVVDHLRELQFVNPEGNVIVLLGNHEDFILRAVGKHEGQSDFRAWWYQGGEATYLSYHDPRDERPFLSTYQRPTDDAFLTEAVVNPYLHPFEPNADMQTAIEWFETLPLYHETEDFIFVHAGLREPYSLQGQKRHDLLWIRDEFHDSTFDWGKTVVYGHTAREEPLVESNKIGLDCRWRGKGYVSGAELGTRDKPIKTLYKGI